MPYYGPDELPQIIYLERTFVAGDFVSGVGYGIQIVMYVTCAQYLWSRRKSRKGSIFLLAYTTVLLLIETIFMVVQANTVQSMYIDNRNYPGGPWSYFLATQNLPINVIFIATLFILTFLSDLLVLWRCWVIWTASGRAVAYAVTFFPALCLLASFVLGTIWILQSSQPGLSFYSKVPIAFGTSYYVVSLSVNIMITILITIRLLMYRRIVAASLSAEYAKQYLSLAAILIESAALYSVFALIFIVTYAIENPLNQIFMGVASSAQIATYLIIYRLADGRAWSTSSQTSEPTAVFGSVSDMRMTEFSSFHGHRSTADHPAEEKPTSGSPRDGSSIWRHLQKSPTLHSVSA